MITSGVTGIRYEEKDIVRIKNPLQASRYYEHNARLVDIYVDKNDRKWVYIFYRADCAKLFDLWIKHEL